MIYDLRRDLYFKNGQSRKAVTKFCVIPSPL